MKLDSLILIDGTRYRVTCSDKSERYLGCELVSNPRLKRTVDTKTDNIKEI
jgi:hypothetical protein